MLPSIGEESNEDSDGSQDECKLHEDTIPEASISEEASPEENFMSQKEFP